jgi:chemotaxis protein MotA
MIVFVGFGIILACVVGGYVAGGGELIVLFQPFEFIIIGGAALGAFIASNSTQTHVLKESLGCLKVLMAGKKYKQQDYLELLSALYSLFRLIKTKGELAIEAHIEHPEESALFMHFPRFLKNHEAVHFVCDYMRLVTLGSKNPFEIDALMDEEIDTLRKEKAHVPHAIQNVADATPALGIVAAVLGVIHTMGSIKEPPEVLGHLIGGRARRHLPRRAAVLRIHRADRFRREGGVGGRGQILRVHAPGAPCLPQWLRAAGGGGVRTQGADPRRASLVRGRREGDSGSSGVGAGARQGRLRQSRSWRATSSSRSSARRRGAAAMMAITVAPGRSPTPTS